MRGIPLYFPYILALIKHAGYALTLHNVGYGPLGYLIFPGI